MEKSSKKDLEDKINELEKKLKQLSSDSYKNELDGNNEEWMKKDDDFIAFENVEDNSPDIGKNNSEMLKELYDAKKDVISNAGLIPTTESGSVLDEDNVEPIKIPSTSIHEFTNLEECECECHPKKQDCVDCYDHPVHLKVKQEHVEKKVDGYTRAQVSELIELDKKKKKKRWYQR